MRTNLVDLRLRINYKPYHQPICVTNATVVKVCLPHLLILEDIYHFQSSLLYRPGTVHKISSQSIWEIFKGFGTIN